MQPQQFLLSLDYELFFGNRVGTVEHCLIRPVDAIREVLDKHGMKMSLFVDAGFLVRLKQQMTQFPQLKSDYQRIESQLQSLIVNGHDVQLHIHPHWEDSHFDGDGWIVDTTRYKLHDFSADEIQRIVREYKQALTDIVGDRVFAYRAGGWCMQPFDVIAPALKSEGIWLDSTVYADGVSEDAQRGFDFRGAPVKESWRFSLDPVVETNDGTFVEIPISACRVSPLLFWKMAFIKKFTKGQHTPFGDGAAMTANAQYYWKRLTSSSISVASIDGLKASFLDFAFTAHKRSGVSQVFNVMGHPKSVTPYAIEKLDQFLTGKGLMQAITFQDLRSYKDCA
jgi:peptidoglycan/xylan/chitin deacetylase (PgdA/CDA1 family)